MNTGGRISGFATELRLPVLSKLYVWSVVLEPLLFFQLVHRDISGVGGNLSRILQFIVIMGLMLKSALSGSRIRVPNPLSRDYFPYVLFMLLSVLSGVMGYVGGAYDLSHQNLTAAALGNPMFSQALNSASFRPLFEYFIYFYYFCYFVVLPRYLLFSTEGVNYFFKIFAFTFFLSFWVGVVDLAAFLAGGNIIRRHLYDPVYVGFRFHGFAGEPRDAFVYLGLGYVLLALRDYWAGEKRLTTYWILAIAAAAVMTQSASGVIGLAFSVALIGLYALGSISVKRLMIFFTLGFFLIVVFYLYVRYSPRILMYLEALEVLYMILDRGEHIPVLLHGQMNNIFPIWQRWLEVREYNVFNLFLGTGHGSASVANNNLSSFLRGMENPHSQMIRTIYESGLIGLVVFVSAFVMPIKRYVTSKRDLHHMSIMMLFLLGLFFGHRSAAPYIYMGALLLVLRYRSFRMLSSNAGVAGHGLVK